MSQVQTATVAQLETAIKNVETKRPTLSVAIEAFYIRVGYETDLIYAESQESADYEIANDSFYKNHYSMLKHLEVALSVAIANEYVFNNL